MALVLRSICDFYQVYLVDYEDPRVRHLPLLKSPFPVVIILILYLGFVLKWGRKWMENRKPFDLTAVINVYNFAQIFINFYIGVMVREFNPRHCDYVFFDPLQILISSYFRKDFSFSCQHKDLSGGKQMNVLIFTSYLYFLSKIVDLLDTVFFVLRKKNNQITFLHTYHHGGMVMATWAYNKYMNASHPTLLFIINSFVHVIMYSYYFLTSFKPELKQSLWWKKHITQIQLLQFLILSVHFALPLLTPNCEFPAFISFIGMSQNVFMFVLFSDFYFKAYMKKSSSSSSKKEQTRERIKSEN
jgi:GNS1/SUR4 family